jgi:hypothetical protein
LADFGRTKPKYSIVSRLSPRELVRKSIWDKIRNEQVVGFITGPGNMNGFPAMMLSGAVNAVTQ